MKKLKSWPDDEAGVKYIYSSTALKYSWMCLSFAWVFPLYATLYFYSTTLQRELFTIYFILHYIYKTANFAD